MHAAGLTRTEYLAVVKAAGGRHRVPRTERGRVEGYCGHVPGATAHSISTVAGLYSQLAYEVGAGVLPSATSSVTGAGTAKLRKPGKPSSETDIPDLDLTMYGDSAYRGSAKTGGSVSGKLERADGRGTGGAVPGGTTGDDAAEADPENTFVAHPAAPLLRGVYSAKVGLTPEQEATTRDGYIKSFLDRKVANTYTPTEDRPKRYLAGKTGVGCMAIGGVAGDRRQSASAASAPTGPRPIVIPPPPSTATATAADVSEIAPVVPVVKYEAPDPQRTSPSNGILGNGYSFALVDRRNAKRNEASIPPGYTGYYPGSKYLIGS
ncbi:uncharacterized protein AMSG_08965 [Thecamonas trahens ATCC 50062]|uniref:Uncharacterized protein n=1 Tax=Thecamonas trahens ATCC 50062 TaxID=461836 RepID=A0A0L0DK88_THETB|nr:hypothetical protein AMSG_08965 [Thecamonas trahens ATCC 50062]KNC52824.1 hypothetical protein AMSG_08965 [Thecamonas trahens ATCC 50062]|eukprot:XP_013754930.1 hypothetical protein AMSG_08965 [Thecamonas trahens ATCC 50062]